MSTIKGVVDRVSEKTGGVMLTGDSFMKLANDEWQLIPGGIEWLNPSGEDVLVTRELIGCEVEFMAVKVGGRWVFENTKILKKGVIAPKSYGSSKFSNPNATRLGAYNSAVETMKLGKTDSMMYGINKVHSFVTPDEAVAEAVRVAEVILKWVEK